MRRCLCLSLLACLLSGLVGVQAATAKPEARHRDDPGLLAPAGTCPDEGDENGAPADQKQAMSCLVDYARRSAGLPEFSTSADLERSASAKSGDILRCDSFSHFACGREFTFWMRRVGYLRGDCWRAAENIAWGGGSGGSARNVMRALIHSPEHRQNILGDYTTFGAGLQIGRLDGHADAHVWTQHFGSHC